MLVEDDDGRWVPAEDVVSTGPELHLLHIANYHMMMMERAAASIDLVASERRDISSVTMLVGEDGLIRMKRRIQRFRRELIELSLLEDEGDQVVQLTFNFFRSRPHDARTPQNENAPVRDLAKPRWLHCHGNRQPSAAGRHGGAGPSAHVPTSRRFAKGPAPSSTNSGSALARFDSTMTVKARATPPAT